MNEIEYDDYEILERAAALVDDLSQSERAYEAGLCKTQAGKSKSTLTALRAENAELREALQGAVIRMEQAVKKTKLPLSQFLDIDAQSFRALLARTAK